MKAVQISSPGADFEIIQKENLQEYLLTQNIL